MSISKDELIKRQEELQTNFDTMKDRIKSMDIELGNLKANLNATAGALQLVNQLLADIDSKAESKEPMPAEKMEALNIATS
jgi:predicted nuclease with TOPRIM domain|tara:strand:+ start:335 stop:577 length:243 start_codon:yes stop_codon:yes gene_type:complete